MSQVRAISNDRSTPRSSAVLLELCLVAVLGLAGASACQRIHPTPGHETTLRIGFGMGGTARLEGMNTLTRILYAEPLVSFSWDGRPRERLADSVEWVNNRTTLEIHLRKGVKLHNGQPLTPALVIETLRREIAGRQARNRPLGGFTHLQSISEIPPSKDPPSKFPDSTIQLKLTRQDLSLIGDLAGLMITDPDKPEMTGTGPFKILNRTSTLVEAERNPDYYRGVPALQRVRIESFDTQRAAWAALMRGDVDMVQEVTRDSVEFLQNNRDLRTYPSIRPFYIALVFNLRHPILRQVAVRHALSEAVDREEIVREAMKGHGQVADDPISPTHWAYSATAHPYALNRAAARLRMAAARLPVRDTPGGDRMASRFRFRCLFWSEDPQYERIALFVQRQLAEIGVDMDLEPTSLQQIGVLVQQGKFDAFLAPANAGRSFDQTYRYWHSPTGPVAEIQDGGYTGADSALDRLRFEAIEDVDVRAAVADLRRRFREDAPAIFLAWTETTRAIDASIDVGDPKDPDAFANIWRWRPAIRQAAAR